MNNLNKNLYNMRKNYVNNSSHNKDIVKKNPIEQFNDWFEEAIKTEKQIEVNSMAISTVGKDGFPSSRYVLLKQFNKDGFYFFTNYNSKKAMDIENCNKVSCLFYWPCINRQIRIKGNIFKVDNSMSEEYFLSRPYKSQISAIISNQSQKLLNREDIKNNFQTKIDDYEKKKYEIKKPDSWGGYIIKPIEYEFWQGKQNRFHERVKYILTDKNDWDIMDLFP